MRDVEDKTLLLLIVVVSILFGWILLPFYGAVLWAVVLAVLFASLHRRMLGAMPAWPNFAALLTLAAIIVMVILPLSVLIDLLLGEANGLFQSIRSGEVTFGVDLQRVRDALPLWATSFLDRLGLQDPGSLRERLSALAMQSGQFLAGKAINVGQSTLDLAISFFLMLYLLYFLLRDGDELSAKLRRAIPLRGDQQRALASKFTVTIRAIVKGSIVVALVQGALGGLIFWFLGIRAALLWAALMAVLSLLPVVGTALVWVPVALYLLATGAVWQGLLLFAYGVVVIGLVDNVLRPILVGSDIRIPDYVVLISTLGGLATFGANGLVIGPVLAAMFIAAWSVFSERRQEWREDGEAP